MKLSIFFTLILGAAVPAAADTKPQAAPASSEIRPMPKEHISSTAPTQSAVADKNVAKPMPGPNPTAATPAPAGPAKPSAALENYLSALNEQVTLSKDEQTDVKAYYQEDATKIHAILNDASLSPIDQQRQIDDLRNARNAKIGALLKDVDRQAKFLEFEKAHRVELLELAAHESSTPAAPIPNVPQPTATTPAQADKATPGV